LPQIDEDGADSRLIQTLRILVEMGHPVTYVARHGANPGHSMEFLQEMGIEVFAGDEARRPIAGWDLPQPASAGEPGSLRQPPAWRFSDVLSRRSFEIALLFQDCEPGISIAEDYLNEIRRESPVTRVAVLLDGLPGTRESRRAAVSGLLTDEERALGWRQRELEYCRAAELVLVASDAEAHTLAQLDPGLPVQVLPRIVRPAPAGGGWSQRAHLLLVANGHEGAIADALQWFRAEIWPRLRRTLPGVRLEVAGESPNKLLWPAAEEVVATASILAQEETLSRCRLLISPLRVSSGIRDENLTALAHGVPLVTTTIGAEGLHLTDGIDALIADSPAAFAAAVTQAYRDESLWARLSANGRRCVEKEFLPDAYRPAMAAAVARLLAIPAASRERDYPWTIRKSEEIETGRRARQSLAASQALVLRMHTCAEYAEHLLQQGRPEEACWQLRHLFTLTRPPLPAEHFFANILILMERCYRALGDHERGARCGREALQFIPELSGKFPPQPAKSGFAGDSVTNPAAARAHGSLAAERSPMPAPVLHQEP
jgi:hypothetical protein